MLQQSVGWKAPQEAKELTQWVKVLTAKPGNQLNSIPRTHTRRGENRLPQIVLRPPHTWIHSLKEKSATQGLLWWFVQWSHVHEPLHPCFANQRQDGRAQTSNGDCYFIPLWYQASNFGSSSSSFFNVQSLFCKCGKNQNFATVKEGWLIETSEALNPVDGTQ